MDGNTSVAVSTRWVNQGRRVPLLRNKDILLHFDSQCVIYTCTCVYKRNQKYFISIYKGTTPSWILFGRYSLFFAWSIIFLKWLQLSHIPNSKIYMYAYIVSSLHVYRDSVQNRTSSISKCCHSQSVVSVMFG